MTDLTDDINSQELPDDGPQPEDDMSEQDANEMGSDADYKGSLSEKGCLNLINNDLELLDRLYDLDLTPEECPPNSRNRDIMCMIANMWNDCKALNQPSASASDSEREEVIKGLEAWVKWRIGRVESLVKAIQLLKQPKPLHGGDGASEMLTFLKAIEKETEQEQADTPDLVRWKRGYEAGAQRLYCETMKSSTGEDVGEGGVAMLENLKAIKEARGIE